MKVRTRIAPSPTGNLHIGTVRTALYNLLFAKHFAGDFYFRLEDTDTERNRDEYTQEIIEGFKHLGIEWDGEIVRQSLRADIHRNYVDQLIQAGKAYKCYATPQELEDLRKEQRAKKIAEGYDNRSRTLSKEEANRLEAEGKPYVIRLNLGADRNIEWQDVIRGEMSINTKDLGGDPVIQKHNGQVLYNFAVVVDDHDMSITHVFRGEDHLTNTAKQIAIYEAFGFPVPIFGHLPLIFTKDKQKLSKRKHGDIAGVDKYIREGYLPEALVNYLVATSYTAPTGTVQELYLIKDAIKDFNIEGMSKSPAIYDIQKLNWFNREYMAKLSFDELVSNLKPFLKYDLSEYSVDDQKLMIDSIRGNLNKFDDINENISYFFEDNIEIDPKLSKSLAESKILLESLAKSLENPDLDWTNSVALKDAINTLGDNLGLHGKQLFLPIRVAISGISHGPDLGLVMYLLGKDLVLKRIKQALAI